ncbi:MAG: beta-galactosidase trimerization domain-containing protein [Victivallales bacterium]|nr:beta-galactosidase trimerization domain-containing protein [Victivallales bacterium]
MLKKLLLVVLAVVCCQIWSFPASSVFHFENRMYLTPWPAKTAERVVVDSENSYQGHASLRMNHVGDSTTAYTGLNVPQAPCEMEMKVNARSLKKCDVKVRFNFNVKGGPNGSAGSVGEVFSVGTEWNEARIQVTVPPNTASVQVVVSTSGPENTLWLNEMSFGFALDTMEFPVVEKVDFNAPLDGEAWNAKKPLDGFFAMAVPVLAAPSARLAADKDGLYVAFINPCKPIAAVHAADTKDAALWNDDCNEIFLFNVATGKGWQFIVNSNGALFDAQIFQQQDGDPWKCDAKWDSEGVKTAATVGEATWESRVFIPWKTLGLSLEAGIELGINVASENKTFHENSMWNCFAGSFNDPAGFAKLRVADGKMGVERSRVLQNIVYTIEREHPTFEEVLRKGEPGNYLVGSWGQGSNKGDYPKPLIEKIGEEKFNEWQDRLFDAYCEAGMFGPAYPWLQNYIHGGEKAIRERNAKYGFRAPYSMHNSALDRMAREKGATIILPRARNVSSLDPILFDVQMNFIQGTQKSRFYKLYCDTSAFIMGIDEPFNGYTEMFSKTVNHQNVATLEKVDAEIREKYGFGKYGLPDYFAEQDADHPFRCIAFNRYFNEKFLENSIKWRDAWREVLPGVPMKMATNNTCGGLAMLDYSLFDKHADWLACDPYPTSAKYTNTYPRAIYHTGFNTKLLADLAPTAKTMIMPQCFIYCSGRPVPSDLREWASQALKNGADGFMWYCSQSATEIFECFKEMIALNGLVSKMDRVDVPTATKTAILFSNYDQFGTNDTVQHGAYTIYSILGEHLKSNFRFISTTGLQNGTASLDDYKLIYAPKLAFTDHALTAKLKQFVKNGGKLVVFDPRFLSWNIDGTPVAGRVELSGVKSIAQKKAQKQIKGFGQTLPLTANINLVLPTGREVEAYDFDLATAKVVATYEDGKPAAVENKVGDGTVVCFATQPFGNSSLALEPKGWLEFFRQNAEAIGEPCGLPIWDFTIPERALKYPNIVKLQ